MFPTAPMPPVTYIFFSTTLCQMASMALLYSWSPVIAATSAISFGITRYRVPVDVVAIVFAGVGIDALLRLVVRAPAHEEPAAVETATMVDTSAS